MGGHGGTSGWLSPDEGGEGGAPGVADDGGGREGVHAGAVCE